MVVGRSSGNCVWAKSIKCDGSENYGMRLEKGLTGWRSGTSSRTFIRVQAEYYSPDTPTPTATRITANTNNMIIANITATTAMANALSQPT